MGCFILLFSAVWVSAPPDGPGAFRLSLSALSRWLVIHHFHGCRRVHHSRIAATLPGVLDRPRALLTHRYVLPILLTIILRGPGRHALVVHHRVDVGDSSHPIVVAEAVLAHAAMGTSFNQILFVQFDAAVALHQQALRLNPALLHNVAASAAVTVVVKPILHDRHGVFGAVTCQRLALALDVLSTGRH